MAVGDIYKLAAKGNLYGTRCVNVFHFRLDGAPSGGTEPEDLNGAFAASILPPWIACISDQMTIGCVEIINITDPGGNPASFLLTAGNVGLVEEPALPANKVAVATLYTANYSRNGRGRKYFAGVPEPHEGDNALAQGVKTNWESLATALVSGVTGGPGSGTWQHCVWSPSLLTEEVVVKCVVGPQIHSLRGRTPTRC